MTESVEIDGVTFQMRADLAGYRWYWPDGTPTEVWRPTEREAARAMMFRGQELAAQWKKANSITAGDTAPDK